MRNAFIVMLILAGFSWYDLRYTITRALKPRARAMAECLKYEQRAIALIFAAFSAYRGFRPVVRNRIGESLPERYLVIANHQSLIDIPIIMHHMPGPAPGRFVAKKELGYGIPLVSKMLRTSGHCLVSRHGDPMQAMKSITAYARRSRKDGTIPVLFPEGTRSRTGELGTFHSAGFRKILEAEKLPIVVASVEGGWQAARLKEFFRSFGESTYHLDYLALLPAPKDKREALAALAESRRLIAESLDRLRKGA